jgi:tRNA threonylcarbamoyladenosine biosynthesis protein TsaB
MLTLAFESSAKAASAALVRDGELFAQSIQCSGLTHSRTLLPMAEDMPKQAGTYQNESVPSHRDTHSQW